MRSDVWLVIRSQQTVEGAEPNQLTFTSEGELYDEDGVIFLRYRESELTGLQGCISTFEIHPGKVLLRRSGLMRMETEFCVGKSLQTLYDTGMGTIMITVRTVSIQDEMTVEGGTLSVSYTISMENLGTSKISFTLEVTPRTAEETE